MIQQIRKTQFPGLTTESEKVRETVNKTVSAEMKGIVKSGTVGRRGGKNNTHRLGVH